MKKLILILIVATFTLNVNSQDNSFSNSEPEPIKTLFGGKGKESTIGGMGAAQISSTTIRDERELLVGGYGGVLLNRQFLAGLYVMGLVTSADFNGMTQDNEEKELTLDMGYGGLYFTYFPMMKTMPVHLSLPLAMGVGAVNIRENTPLWSSNASTHVETSVVFMIEPGVNINFNFSKFFILSAGVSYRYAMLDRTLINITEQDLSALSINLALNFGKF